MLSRLVAALMLGVCLLFVACGGPPTNMQDPSARDLQQAYQRLEGSWKLARFQPQEPLGPPFDGLVREAVGQLTLSMSGGTLSATGAGLQVKRRYEIVSATPDAANAVIIDDAGARFDFDLLFQGKELFFVCKSDPWRGQGSLVRTLL